MFETLCVLFSATTREEKEAHSVVIMDNCSIHYDPEIKRLIESKGAILIYSAPYCPELIPIEYMFHQWKAYLKRYNESFGKDWFTVHIAALASVTPQQGLNYFKKTTLVELVENHPLSEDYQRKYAAVVAVAAATFLVFDD